VASYVYDADGNRYSVSNAGTTTSYVVDTSLPYASVVEEYSNGTLAARYDYGDDLVRMNRGSGVYYYIYDGLGSTRQLVNTTGAVTDTWGYSAFGELASHTGSTINPFLFNAQQFDGASGNYYLRARYYDQSVGRFISQDPFEGSGEDPVSLHRYLYAAGDPTNNTDPTGMETLFGLSISLAIRTTIATISTGAIFGSVTSLQGGSPSQVLQSTIYGAQSGFALAFASAKGNGLTTAVSAVFGGLASLILKAILQPRFHPGVPLSALDGSIAFERGFASSALSSAFSGDGKGLFGKSSSVLYKGALSFNITFYDDLANFLRSDYEDSKLGFSDLPNQIKYSFVDGLVSGGLAGLKQSLVDEYSNSGSYPGNTAQLFSGLSDKDFTKISLDAIQKISSTYLKSFLKPFANGLDPNIN